MFIFTVYPPDLSQGPFIRLRTEGQPLDRGGVPRGDWPAGNAPQLG